MKPTYPNIAFSLLTNVRNTFLYGRPEDTIFKGTGVHFICWELSHTRDEMLHRGYRESEELCATVRELDNYIQQGLVDWRGNRWAGLNSWVRASCPRAPLMNEIGTQMRTAWLDRMIHELETKGTLP